MAKTPTDIRSSARAHTATAVRTLAGIMKERRAPAAARVSAAIALLDRGWGKPQQAIEMDYRLDSSAAVVTSSRSRPSWRVLRRSVPVRAIGARRGPRGFRSFS